MAIYDSIKYPYDSFSKKKLSKKEEIKVFVVENFPLDVIKQYVDREEIIKRNRERSIYIKQKFNKSIKED